MTWAGRTVTNARAYWARLLPLPCWRCRKPVLPEHRWQVEHIVERALGGGDDIGNQWVSHGACNESAGGKLGGQRRAARAAEQSTRRRETRPLAW